MPRFSVDESLRQHPNPVLIEAAQDALMNSNYAVASNEKVDLIEVPVSNPRGTMNWKSFGRALRWLGPVSVLLAGLWVSAWTPARAQSGSAAPSAERKTSTPYTGDLSIFDSPGRDERLQINRVMDMLGH